MNNVPISAIVLALALIFIIGCFLVHMILSQVPDAQLQFYLDLMGGAEEGSEDSSGHKPSPCLPHDGVLRTSGGMASSAAGEVKSHPRAAILREVPVLFATALRGRGL